MPQSSTPTILPIRHPRKSRPDDTAEKTPSLPLRNIAGWKREQSGWKQRPTGCGVPPRSARPPGNTRSTALAMLKRPSAGAWDRALLEIARVLTPGGVLAGRWNVEDDRVGWVAGLAAISKSGRTLSRWRATPEADTEQGALRAGSSWFASAEEGEFGHGQLRSADSLVATLATRSWMLVMDEAERARTLATIRDFLARQPETSVGEFTLPLITVALRAVRRP